MTMIVDNSSVSTAGGGVLRMLDHDDPSSNVDFGLPVGILVILVVLCCLCCNGKRSPPVPQSQPLELSDSQAPPRNDTANNGRASSIQELKERYDNAFEQSKHQTVLLSSQILQDKPSTDESTEIENDIEKGDDGAIQIALESARSVRSRSINTNQAFILHPAYECVLVGGTCAICLEEMEAGEEVVWSETESCRHLYHKDCLVSFLAHNSERAKNENNPCPACRQNFVTVQQPATADNDDVL